MKYQIITTTDGHFVGLIFDSLDNINIGGSVFTVDKTLVVSDGIHRVSNSNYVIDLKEV